MTTMIKESVGQHGRNKPVDVAVMQAMVTHYCTTLGPQVKGRSCSLIAPNIQVDGECSQALIDLIKSIQAENGAKHPDGRVDPHGKTLHTILSKTGNHLLGPKAYVFGPAPGNTNTLQKVDPKRLRKLVIRQLGLTISDGEDFLGFFDMLQKDTAITDIRWAAYMLATVYLETQESFLPIHETDGSARPYGQEREVTDTLGCRGPKGAKYKNRYYGRGYCQLSLWVNYKSLGHALGMGDELYINPDKVTEKKLAYEIISHGMRHGSFMNHKLSDHINGKKCDYKHARNIVNGKGDRADDIARYAEDFEFLLRLCSGPVVLPPRPPVR